MYARELNQLSMLPVGLPKMYASELNQLSMLPVGFIQNKESDVLEADLVFVDVSQQTA